jgi:hypothetical protein
MKKILLAAFASLALISCTTLPDGTRDLQQEAYKAVYIPFQLYTTVYQPLLIEYGKRPDCTLKVAIICKDSKVYAKLVDADGKAVAAMQVADNAIRTGTTTVADPLTTAVAVVQQVMVDMAPLIAEAQTKEIK